MIYSNIVRFPGGDEQHQRWNARALDTPGVVLLHGYKSRKQVAERIDDLMDVPPTEALKGLDE